MKGKIQIGYLVSYDYELLKKSIPIIYQDADTIFFAIDKKRLTWKGDSFFIEESFFQWIDNFDIENKIVIYEEDFYVPTLTTMECEIRERKMLSEKMGIGNWLIQIDSDEYFVNFKQFVYDLREYDSYLENPEKKPVQICAFLIMLYKYTDNGILYVDKPQKAIFATNYPEYMFGRRTYGRQIYTNNIVLHESLSRTEEDLRFKLKNWGHNAEVDNGFLVKWLKVNENNYKEYRDFHYSKPKRCKKLAFFPTKTISEIKDIIREENRLNRSASLLWFKNFEQRIKFLSKKYFFGIDNKSVSD
ncbi:hypothetical protein SGQ83_02455 [Flavobacterium sp. Fl-318]|uniref:Glycosyl transferase family 2 n=1 Tax=Flavobacterium cupriresistens TaxID=2893885 RepID=A0ABU4R6H6_9FLAO|nr:MULTISPECIES: hypothetical protein [unclassified Flavobacterium]MDX6188195.1 hypothetical protein [Flavobacterium sp. Fl-318]UFH40761.1 hypothetical protein LNP23_13185 [Flavobacterium sp. F-323]